MKKVFVLILVMTMVAVMTACGGSNGSSDNPQASSSSSAPSASSSDTSASPSAAPSADDNKPAELTLWVSWDPSAADKEVYEAFKQKTGIAINAVSVPYDQYRPKLVAALLSGEGPDVLNVGIDDFPSYIVKNLVAPIDDYMTLPKSTFPKQAIDAFSDGEHTYALTGAGSIRLIYYNKALFQKYSLPDPLDLYSQGKWNWDAFLNAAKTITKDTNGDGKIDQFGYGDWSDPEPFIYSNGGLIVDYDHKFMAANQEATEALQFAADLSLKHHVRVEGEDFTQAFQAGRVAMMNEGDWGFEGMKNSNMKDEWDIVPFPAGKGGNLSTEYFAGYSVNPNSKSLKYSVAFLEFMNGPEGLAIYNQGSTMTDAQKAIKEAALAGGVPSIYQGYPKLKQLIGDTFAAVNSGKKNATQAMQEIKDQGQAAIDEVMAATK